MKHTILLAALASMSIDASAQTCSDFLKAYKPTDAVVPFDVNSEGETFRIKWGMDTAWDWDFNVNRGVAHYGKGNFETGRISFTPNDLVIDNGDGTYTLTAAQKKTLQNRINHIKATGATEVNINSDQEAMNDRDGVSHYQGKPEEWYKLIKASVAYAQSQGLKVVSISPFNEPDYGWQQYKYRLLYNDINRAQPADMINGKKDFLEIAKLIKADPFFDGIRICGGNTLSCDEALPWYNYLKEHLDEGNTHQLAGSFDTYANFFKQVKADGKVATADELHNVGEAIVGAQYGMETGIWWAFDAKARGQFMHDSNEGVRIGYAEDRSHWTVSAVYRNEETKEVHGYVGSSERQANTSSYQFVSKGKEVFFNGYGPTRHWMYEIPGGPKGSYQNGQINAEKLFDITWGEDVAPLPEVNGTYKIMNASSKKFLTYGGVNANVKSDSHKSSGTTQQWIVSPITKFGDCSYHVLDNAGVPAQHMNLRDKNLNDNAEVMTYAGDHPDEEQWYIKYAGEGYYYIISRLSDKYLYCSSTTAGTQLRLKTAPTASTKDTERKKYMWRFQPSDSKSDTKAPAAPEMVSARQRSASIELTWKAPADEDVTSYTILRADNGEWNTIGRGDTLTTFVDNSVTPGHSYAYKVFAVDYSGNRSAFSDTINAAPLHDKAMLCQLQFDESLNDATANKYSAAIYGDAKYSTTSSLVKSGKASLNMTAGTNYAMISPSLADLDEMTISTWVRMSNSYAGWMRLFDFGNGTDQYMFFTPSNGSQMRFVMKNGGDEQILSNGTKKLASAKWQHVAVTIKPINGGKVQAILYVDGAVVAESSEFTIKPSDIAPSLCYIGRSMFSGDPLLKAYIDDFRIYNHALSADEITAVMADLGDVAADYKDTFKDVTPSEPDAILGTEADDETAQTYDLNGRATNSNAAGIVIKQNKKYLNK